MHTILGAPAMIDVQFKSHQSLVADPYNEWFRLAIAHQSDKIKLSGLSGSRLFRGLKNNGPR